MIARNPRVIWDTVDDVLVLLHTETGEFFELNDTAASAWNASDGRSIAELARLLQREYPGVARRIVAEDCRELVAVLVAHDLLQPVG